MLIVGAGFGGIAAAIELRRHGFTDLRILDGAPSLGGTWFHNSYPGAACDVPSHLYSYSFDQRLDWSRLCSPQGEILRYLHEVARDQGVEALIERLDRLRLLVSRRAWPDRHQLAGLHAGIPQTDADLRAIRV